VLAVRVPSTVLLPPAPSLVRGAGVPTARSYAFPISPFLLPPSAGLPPLSRVILNAFIRDVFWPRLWSRVRNLVTLDLASREFVHADLATRPLVALATNTRPYATLAVQTRPLITMRAFSRQGADSMTKLGGTEQLDVDISTRINNSDATVDPTTLTLTVQDPIQAKTGASTTYSLAGGQISKRTDATGNPMVGRYTCPVVCSTASGNWKYRWNCDIGKPGVEEGAFTVAPLSF
jgi:hypothetical protein